MRIASVDSAEIRVPDWTTLVKGVYSVLLAFRGNSTLKSAPFYSKSKVSRATV